MKAMYLNYYHLTKEPFKITCDPEFLWFSEKHKEALANLQYGLLGNCGFVLLTGEVGTGKTLLINKLLTMLPKETIAASLSGHNLNSLDLFRLLADRLNLQYKFNSKSEFLLAFQNYLLESNANGRRIVLILDEAQVFEQQVLEDIRMLSNVEFPDQKLISIFLVGQPELNLALRKTENRALRQRITTRHHLEVLNQDETENYIKHRLKIAGSSRAIFSQKALKRIYECSGGIPRIINVICDRALLTGSLYKLETVDAKTVLECVQELQLPKPANDLPLTEVRESDISTIEVPVKKPLFPRLAYAGGILTVVMALTLVLLKFDVKPPLATIEKNPSIVSSIATVPAMAVEEKKPMVPGWPENRKIPIQFKDAEISQNSNHAINRVARQLVAFPEQAIAVYGCIGATDSPEHQRLLSQQQGKTIRSQLMRKGVFSYQIKLMDMNPKATHAGLKANSAHDALIEFYQSPDLAAHNQDK